MVSLKHKLALGFGGLLAIIAVIGLLTIRQVDELGSAIDVILKQNYRSVAAAQEMKEALEKMNIDVLQSFSAEHLANPASIASSETRFRQALQTELGNITLPGEKEKADRIALLFDNYIKVIHAVSSDSMALEKRRDLYFMTALPLLAEIKTLAQQILDMNQANMNEANYAARRLAESAHNRILLAIAASAAVALIFSYQSRRWILKPVSRLIASANEIRNGNLDLVIETTSNDEIGQLSQAFNQMATKLRQVRRDDDEKLERSRKATQRVMNILPAPIAIFDPEGRVDFATHSAIRNFGIEPGTSAAQLGYDWLADLLWQAVETGGTVELSGNGYIQKFIENREFFFRPAATAIPRAPGGNGSSGVVLLLHDMTQAQEQKELKRGVVSTVSHQLRTPLTALRMAIHLLVEQRVGPLNDKQSELLHSALEESDRLAEILDDLLDLHKIESGKSRLNMTPQKPETLVKEGVEPFVGDMKEKAIRLMLDIPTALPEVQADAASIRHVFANLLSNAIRFTPNSGAITVRAQAELAGVRFSVEDTGSGIEPEHLKHLFDQFYRVPGQDEKSGIGLGLSIVREIVHMHGGTVGVESTLGKGSVFHFTLPEV
ncbi:HAMP domain-containing protein [Chlorobaculum thiosulfatiphilum]|uniref:histidine kinase n=1 Tax=Chlorobaculum thiosulfatiphilum TaxID=115852 RepID=A0A5C4S9B1_CHLTI|nr:sensor histidine kinase [Chlorobaculum thiosulfatiphilum]TNJ39311.1 HAMP domain-containing protein [Chlorobaculum thiosulfatiphilum]